LLLLHRSAPLLALWLITVTTFGIYDLFSHTFSLWMHFYLTLLKTAKFTEY